MLKSSLTNPSSDKNISELDTVEVPNELIVEENIDNDINTDEDIDNNINTDEDIDNDINTDEDIDNNINTDEDIDIDINTDEDIDNDINTDEDIDNDINTDEDIDNDINTDENIDNDINTDEDIDEDIDIDVFYKEQHIENIKSINLLYNRFFSVIIALLLVAIVIYQMIDYYFFKKVDICFKPTFQEIQLVANDLAYTNIPFEINSNDIGYHITVSLREANTLKKAYDEIELQKAENAKLQKRKKN